jgi:hypothetical protein
MSTAVLLSELRQLGIKLETRGSRLRYFPKSGLTPALIERVKAHKSELIDLVTGDNQKSEQVVDGGFRPTVVTRDGKVRIVTDVETDFYNSLIELKNKPSVKWQRGSCRHSKFQDIPIHGGQSTRRDCARCGRFIEFPIWYGQTSDT